MRFEKKQLKHYLVFTLHEEIDLDKDTEDLKNEIDAALKSNNKFIALKFTHVSYIYSGIINVIAHYFKEIKAMGGMLAILETNQSLYDVLDIIGVTRVMSIFRTEKDFEQYIDGK